MSFAVDHDTVSFGKVARRYLLIVSHKRRVVYIVLDKNRAEVNVPVAAGWAMDDEGTSQTIGVLLLRLVRGSRASERWCMKYKPAMNNENDTKYARTATP